MTLNSAVVIAFSAPHTSTRTRARATTLLNERSPAQKNKTSASRRKSCILRVELTIPATKPGGGVTRREGHAIGPTRVIPGFPTPARSRTPHPRFVREALPRQHHTKGHRSPRYCVDTQRPPSARERHAKAARPTCIFGTARGCRVSTTATE